MPRPLRLPANAPIIVHIQQPAQMMATLEAYAPDLPRGRALLQQAISQGNGQPIDEALATAVNMRKPWDMASVDGQLIVQVPLLPGKVQSVAAALADKPPVGRFGAVDLQRGAAPGPKLAWLDRDSATLTLADTERGLATGSKLASAYGKQPLRVEIEATEAQRLMPQLQMKLESVEIRGAGAHDFEAVLEGVPSEAFAQIEKLESGSLTGLLESSQIAVGASSKYTDHAKDVKNILADAKRTVDRQNFLVRDTLEGLRKRLGTTLRSWNGRVMVGVAPGKTVLVGFGADDPKHMGGALYHLLTGIIDNLGTARSLGIEVPRLRFKRNAVRAAEQNIAILVLERARKYLPPEATPLIDDRGELRIAFAFPNRTGAGMMALGPASESAMTKWLEDTAKATPASESSDHYMAGTVAVDPGSLASLAKGVDLGAVLGLTAERDPTRITLTRDGATVRATVKGPPVEVKPRRFGAGRGQGGSAASGTMKPARRVPSKGKPVK
ncbi:MAG: hypothetical protein AAF799_12735 [Myxococcota bacterium]